ncbi:MULTISPECIES: methionine ABC transporter ATP-binding protein [Caulobacter]|uniref:Cell division ATP-binding protein FtsE n=1 Tax=Caulobacter vibrioides OR37 TaxID=1292034 RepID=R0CYB7_CAUVI|nr:MULTISPECIES: methionine ABC transporter ATP-binding protein [Caulobacter]ENZ81275.1 ABC-type metal ion transport system, ATPase component [Caulobacter vibrioides OR37]MBQ1560018.1 methionine ABC transporter ATP-binding protein [Caulobacter sp.]
MITFQDASKTYAAGGHAALSDVSLSVAAGEVFGVIGASGAGKSTLIRLINGLETPTGGKVIVDGDDVAALGVEGLRALRRRVGMIFQHFNLLSGKTVAQNVAFPLKLAGRPAAEVKARTAELLDRVGLTAHADKYPAQLSGGQKQRVGIARALATHPKVLLCDEATSALDPETTEQILDLISGLNRELGLTIVLITHEMDVVRRVCDRVAVLEAGRVVETGPVERVFLHPASDTAARFVREADGEAAAAPGVGGRLVRLTFKGEATYKPVLGEVARATGVDYSILGGRIHRLRETPYGQLTLALTGGDVGAAIARFQAAGVRVDDLSSGEGA